MKKFSWKMAAAILAAGLTLASLSLTASAASVSDFVDVKPGSWYYNAVEYAVDNGLFSGTSNTTFSPEQGMTRGMFVTVLGRKNGVDAAAYSGTRFDDVKAGDYFAPYVDWAATHGIVSGTSEDRFSPNAQITREQMAAILYRYGQKTGNDASFTEGAVYKFADDGRISDYAHDGLEWAVTHGIINGSKKPGSAYDWLQPKGTATRAQVAQVFMGCKDILVNTELTDTPDVPEPEKLEYGIAILVNGKPVTEDNVRELLYSLQSIYPEGMEWGDEQDKTCFDFMSACWDALGAHYLDPYAKWSRENPANFDNLRSGDSVSYANENTAVIGHTVVVLEKLGDEIIVAEGNYGGTVHWGRVITRQELENSKMFLSDSFYPVY